MIIITIRRGGTVVSTWTIPGPGFHSWTVDGLTLEANAQPQYMYLQQPANTTYSTAPITSNDMLSAAAIDRMSKTISNLLDVVLAELQKERDFWRSRAQALETENALLRSDG